MPSAPCVLHRLGISGIDMWILVGPVPCGPGSLWARAPDAGSGRAPRLALPQLEAACLMRLVSSVTWVKVERRSAMRVRIFLSALMTVV